MKKKSRANKRIREGDMVIAISGNDKGKKGKVLSCIEDRAIVQGINLRKKHQKASEQNPKGGIIEMEGPMHLSNLQIVVDDKPVKLRVKKNKEGEKELVYLKEGKEQLHRPVKKLKK